MSATPAHRVSTGERINHEAPGRLQSELTARGIRLTRQRRVLLQVMETARRHLDAGEILERAKAEKADLIGLYESIAERAGYKIAGGYIDRIEDACMALATFPKRGRRRDELLSGLRTIGFERRVTIAFRVPNTQVEIVTIAYAGRNFEDDLQG